MCIFDLKKHLLRFLSSHLPEEEPILVGCSGGVDSFSMLHALHGQRRRIVAVHIDHGWREESSREADDLQKKIVQMGLEYQGYRLSKAPPNVNLEDWSRVQRYACFREASIAFGIRTLVLAHQADDQVETVVKRFLEGASLLKLRGMKGVDSRDGLVILRPLLDVPRRELELYARTHSIEYVDDPSNADISYLRPRLRHVILPFLENSFGKKIQKSILRLADETMEFESYLQNEMENAFDVYAVRDCMLAQSRNEETNRVLARFLIRQLLSLQGFVPLSRQQIDSAVKVLCSKNTTPVRFSTKNSGVIVQGGMVCAIHAAVPEIEPVNCSIEEGSVRIGLVDISWRQTYFESQSALHWRTLFSDGECRMFIPLEPFVLQSTTSDLLAKTKKKIASPSLLRSRIPGVFQGFRLVGDFLTGYTIPLKKGDRCIELSAAIKKRL